nr:hypothetical protein [Tanacetum cinerariifolium]
CCGAACRRPSRLAAGLFVKPKTSACRHHPRSPCSP